MLLTAGANPGRYRNCDGQPTWVLWAALQAGSERDLIELLLDHAADPNAAGPDGRTPHQLATAAGRTDIADLLLRHGAIDTATEADRFLSACRRADRVQAEQLLEDDPGLLGRLSDEERASIFRAAEQGDTAAVGLMLDLGFPLQTRGDNGGTPLHAAAYNGSPPTVRLLLDRGAEIEAHDTTWNDTPLGWAAVGSGERPRTNSAADWTETVRTLREHGASTTEISLGADDPKPPSPEVAELLQAHIDQLPLR
jgi:ankyrin repeat protein